MDSATDLAPPDGFAAADFTPGFFDHAGPYFLKRAGAGTLVGIRIVPSHVNYIDVAHGGVLATLADVALSYQAHASETPHLNVATNSLTVNFLAGAKLGDWVEAHARLDRIGTRTAYCSGEIRTGERLLATMTAVFTILRPRED